MSAHRYTDANDAVLATAGSRDDLASVVLGSGRLYAAFVADTKNLDSVRERVRTGFIKASNIGFFDKTMTSTPVVIGPGLLPEAVPGNNERAAIHRHLADLVRGAGERGPTPEQHQLRVAEATAAKFGLTIKVREMRHYINCQPLIRNRGIVPQARVGMVESVNSADSLRSIAAPEFHRLPQKCQFEFDAGATCR